MIEPRVLLNFQQFDLLIDGLRRGSDLTWPPAENVIAREPSNEAYHQVLVERVGFLAALGSEEATPSGETARPVKRRGRKPGSGSFDNADALLLIEMKKLIDRAPPSGVGSDGSGTDRTRAFKLAL